MSLCIALIQQEILWLRALSSLAWNLLCWLMCLRSCFSTWSCQCNPIKWEKGAGWRTRWSWEAALPCLFNKLLPCWCFQAELFHSISTDIESVSIYFVDNHRLLRFVIICVTEREMLPMVQQSLSMPCKKADCFGFWGVGGNKTKQNKNSLESNAIKFLILVRI